MAEFISLQAASGRPLTLFEALSEMDSLCESLASQGIPFIRRTVRKCGGECTSVEDPADANSEVVTARYSEKTSLVIGFAPIEKRKSELQKEGH